MDLRFQSLKHLTQELAKEKKIPVLQNNFINKTLINRVLFRYNFFYMNTIQPRLFLSYAC